MASACHTRADRLGRHAADALPSWVLTFGVEEYPEWAPIEAASGTVGPEGPAGPQGEPGADGAPGPQGEQGVPGPQGVSGPAGPEGPPGADGSDGAPGPAGADGAQGPKGDTGAAGATGPQGLPGADGAAGAQGPQGIQGVKGDTGAQGPKGDTGAAGADGAAGPAGPSLHRITWGGTITSGTAPGIVWTNMPAGKTTWLHATSGTLTHDATQQADLTGTSQARLACAVQVAGSGATTLLAVEYSTDGSNWSALLSLTIGSSTGLKATAWTAVPAGAKDEVYLRLVGQNGNGVADPRFSPVVMEVR